MQADKLWKQSISVALCALLILNVLLPAGKASGGIPVPAVKPSYADFLKIKATEDSGQQVKLEPEFMGINNKIITLLQLPGIDLDKKAGAKSPLSAENAILYKEIFRLQSYGNMKEADAKIARLTDKRLYSDVLFQRYMHPTAYKTTFAELDDWLTRFPDHPGAERIHKLAVSRRPEGHKGGWANLKFRSEVPEIHEPKMATPKTYVSNKARTPEQSQNIRALSVKVRSLVSEGEPGLAQETLYTAEAVQHMDEAERDALKAEIALGYLYDGQTARALDLSRESVRRSGEAVPLASWVAGLGLWLKKDYANAAIYFEKAGTSPYASPWLASGGSYWAARSHMRAKNVKDVSRWYREAAKHTRTFYGLLALRALGQDVRLNWENAAYTPADEQKLLDTVEGRRAMALVAAGQYDLAERELLHFDFAANPSMRPVVLAYAGHVGLSEVALRLGSMLDAPGGKLYDAALYPVLPWEPEGGYELDPALVHAIVRQESRFDPQARSPSGASGLMQIMPDTARHVLRSSAMTDEGVETLLSRPGENLTIGQAYMKELLADKNVNGDVISMLAAYNAGPGNLARWKKKFGPVTDPLLFVEMIPVSETRTYVKRVMANYWIYSLRGGQGVRTLEALSSGQSPRYAFAPEDEKAFKLAANQ
ncbi:MAG: lytic transglycosylase domain-containing protein [Alphaproteobacteria bacterium]|nr:lytic transglycosylase domain-containing protein [Alphaproteobacteria bacterium]QQS58199.1 MAG: lytic transglycosylase domain-containing protein [Alphaproteobacteria bacterium]